MDDLELLRKLASRFDPRIVQPDEFARVAFYRIIDLLHEAEIDLEVRATAVRNAQKEVVNYAKDLMQHGERSATTLVNTLYRHFDLMVEGPEEDVTTEARPTNLIDSPGFVGAEGEWQPLLVPAGSHWATIKADGIVIAMGPCQCESPAFGPHKIGLSNG